MKKDVQGQLTCVVYDAVLGICELLTQGGAQQGVGLCSIKGRFVNGNSACEPGVIDGAGYGPSRQVKIDAGTVPVSGLGRDLDKLSAALGQFIQLPYKQGLSGNCKWLYASSAPMGSAARIFS